MGGAKEHGVLVWAQPRHPHADPNEDVRVNITVALPTSVLHYGDFTTDLPLFAHSIDDFFDLWNPNEFEAIRLKTSNADINHGEIIARALFIQTSNAMVEGFFGGVELSVETTNAPIRVVAWMWGKTDAAESQVQLKTSNGPINVQMLIVPKYKDNIFRIMAQTSGASLNLEIAQGGDTRLFLDASTSFEPVTVSLASRYEGTYDLQTTSAQVQVDLDMDAHDPTGHGRHRTVKKTSEGEHAQGSIYWSGDDETTPGLQWGSVKVTTSQSPIKMHFPY
ncbi:hypothetical protein DFH09DRAFT_1212771 [Mycena vulgaris]|nr:hypothetical protein DFH09DRAFT_1212771 [Mycena vulgaris]